MSILVTCGTGFIGANFVLDRISEDGESVVNLDKLPHAGNRQNLSSIANSKQHQFVKGGIADPIL